MTSRFWSKPNITLSYWLALSAALIAFGIVSEQLLFASFLGLGAITIRSISTVVSKRVHNSIRFAFTLIAYTAALLPLWPEDLSAYYYAPLILVLGIALIAAFNRQSYGGSRGVTSIAAIAFLLFIRNIVLYFHFEAPLPELYFSFAFVGLMEIALSNRYQKSEDNPHPELVFGLLLAFVASFKFTSLPLAIVLAALPVLAFLIRNHELAQIANVHTRNATQISDPTLNKNARTGLLPLVLVPLTAASLLYLTILQAPFWADLLPRDAPYLAKSIAQKATNLSNAANLEDERIQEVTNKLVDQQFLKQKATQLAESWNRKKASDTDLSRENGLQPPVSKTTNIQETLPYEKDNYDYSFGPFARNRENANQSNRESASGIGSTFPQLSESRSTEQAQGQRFDPNQPPNAKNLTTGIPNGIETDLSNFVHADEANRNSNATASLPNAISTKIEEALSYQNPDFDQFLESFEKPEQAITQALNLEGSDVSALLSEEALVTVKLNSTRAAPRRLYLRSNVLDTVGKNGIDGVRSEEGKIELTTSDDPVLTLRAFRQSKNAASTLTITSNQSRSPTLPLPESFGSIQLFGTDTLKVYPNERVALAPRSSEPISYRVFEADLEITDRERKTANISPDYRDLMLEVPLSQEDRKYLTKLAKRVGGSRSPSRQFAYRFANYFANRHPYSYFVSIPPGPGHSVVRWLESESPGLCSNYAAAFTLLARSRGIPTRVVGGFASNEFNAKESRYIMRQNNAHAWVEYLDESNRWIRFDPTPEISEAEVKRAAQYVNAGNTQSLQRLLSQEAKLAKPLPFSQEDSSSTIADASKETIQETSATSRPQNEQMSEAKNQGFPSTTSQKPEPSPVPGQPLEPKEKSFTKRSTGPASQNEGLTPPEADTSHSAKNQYIHSPLEPPPIDSTPQNTNNPPWLILLAILAIIIPGIAYLMRIQKPVAIRPELQLRHQAGRLLSKLDSLLQEHHLSNDPIWIETRQTLSEQRYGRKTNPVLVQDLAVKVGLLSKRKKSK